jgi:GT2 family glycosyltransferase
MLMSLPLVSLVVLNWNGASLLKECIGSLKRLDYKNVEVIVVDNASTDESLEVLASIEGVTVVRNRTNLGYAGGNNAGFAAAHGAYVATINNDISVERAWLDEPVALLEKDNSIGIISSRQMNYFDRDTIDALYSFLHHSMILFQEGFRQRFDAQAGGFSPLQVLGASGASTLYRKKMLDDLGGYDERLFAYHEESDLCMRAFLTGWKCVYVPSAVAFHQRSATFNRVRGTMFYYHTRNRLWFMYRYSPVSMIAKNLFWIVITELRIFRVVVFRERVLLSYLRGLIDGFRGMPSFAGARRSNMERLTKKKKEYMLFVKRRYIPYPPAR